MKPINIVLKTGSDQLVRLSVGHGSSHVRWIGSEDDWTGIRPGELDGSTIIIFFFFTAPKRRHFDHLQPLTHLPRPPPSPHTQNTAHACHQRAPPPPRRAPAVFPHPPSSLHRLPMIPFSGIFIYLLIHLHYYLFYFIFVIFFSFLFKNKFWNF